jgi:hypothetical protein
MWSFRSSNVYDARDVPIFAENARLIVVHFQGVSIFGGGIDAARGCGDCQEFDRQKGKLPRRPIFIYNIKW